MENSTAHIAKPLISMAQMYHMRLSILNGCRAVQPEGKFQCVETPIEAIDKLLAVARKGFVNVVVDAGSTPDPSGTALLTEASTIYLATHGSIPERRNTCHLISQFFTTGAPSLEIVLDRLQTGTYGIDEQQVSRDIRQRASSACGLLVTPEKKKGFSFFR
jgi:hypothetical protein